MIMDGVHVEVEKGISEQEIQTIINDEKEIWRKKGKELAFVELSLDGEEILIKSKPKAHIKRIRRITGYLSTVDNFNDAKQAELAERVAHL